MTPDQQRIAIAEACGWERVYTGPVKIGVWIHKDCPHCNQGEIHSHGIDELPDCLNDLNAMHEAEKTLTGRHQIIYCDLLDREVFKNGLNPSMSTRMHVTNATASQRAEAFLKTIGKWID